MGSLNLIDYGVIIFYLGFLIAMGFYLKNKASQSLEDYFLGGRKLPWWALGITGMAQFLDITGTMIIIDYGVIVFYLGFLVAMGFYLKNKASQSLEDYFLGGRKLPWWALGITGMAQFLDITGTMIIVSFLYMLGPRGLR